VGLLNTAVWFGAAVFFALGVGPGTSSQEMENLLGPKNYPYYSGAIGQIMADRYYHLQFVCGILALLHLLAGWLYLGKSPRKLWLGLLVGLISLSLVGGGWVEPRLKELHSLQYTRADKHQAAAAGRSFRTWQVVSKMLNLLLVGGLGVYLWRVANPPDPTRFVSAAKFRS
jgi:hypothetical protein